MLSSLRTLLAALAPGLGWTLSTAGLAALLFMLSGPVPPELVLDRSVPLLAQPWRLLSAHLVHASFNHLLWDGAGLLLVGWLYEPLLGTRMKWVLLCGAILLSLALRFLPGIPETYCGLSGLINVIIGAGLVAAAFRRDWPLVLFALGVAVKIGFENVAGTTLVSDIGCIPVPLAHAAGFLIGIGILLPMQAVSGSWQQFRRGHPAHILVGARRIRRH